MSQYDNQDYYKIGGRSGGPAGPLDQFKRQVSRKSAVLDRDQERVLPGERPRAGIKRGGGGKGGKKASAIDKLPKVVGTAGISSRSKAPVTRTAAELADLARASRAMADAASDRPGDDAVASPTPTEAWNPERTAPPAPAPTGPAAFGAAASGEFTRLAGGEPDVPAWLWPALRPFRPALRLIGGAARLLDSPVRYTLGVMQRVGRLAEAQPRRA